MLTDVLSFILLFVLSPRFIMSVRELYEHDSRRGGQRGSGLGIDSGFGLSGQLRSYGATGMPSIMFAEAEGSVTPPEGAAGIPMVGIRATEC